MNIGKAIKVCRMLRNLNQGELADKAGISPSSLSLLERGKRGINISKLDKLAQALEIPLHILIHMAMVD